MKFLARASRHVRRRGHTLIEVGIAAIILGLMFVAVGMTTESGNAAFRQGLSSAVIETQAQRLLDRIAKEFLDADRVNLTITNPPPGGPIQINYRRPDGFAAGAILWGPLRQITLRPTPNDPNDGVDNDSDGLIDECRVVLIPDVGVVPQVEQTLGSSVREYLEGEIGNMADDNGNTVSDERGLWATYDAATFTLTVRLTVEGRTPEGVLLTRTVQTSILVRNQT